MPRQERFESLKAKHQTLEHQLQTEGVRPYPDTARVLSLKREKLRLKDEMERLAASP
jgi:hypothetical protein